MSYLSLIATVRLHSRLNETTFGTTVPLPTYAVAFAITAQPAAEIEHNGKMVLQIIPIFFTRRLSAAQNLNDYHKYKKNYQIRAIGRDRMQLVQELPSSMNLVMSQSVFENVTFFPEKTGEFHFVNQGHGESVGTSLFFWPRPSSRISLAHSECS